MTASPASVAQRTRQRRQRAMLMAAMAGCHIVFLPAVALVWALAGRLAGANALVAAAVTMLFFASGLGSQVVAAEMGGSLGIGVTLFSFLTRAALLAGLVLLARRANLESHLDAVGIMSGAGAASAGWVGGLIWSEVRGALAGLRHDVLSRVERVGVDVTPPERADRVTAS